MQKAINNRFSIVLASAICRVIPPRLGYYIASITADWIAAHREWKIVRALRANQWVVYGGKLTKEELDHAVRDTLRNTGRSIFDLNHYIHNPKAISQMIVPSPATYSLLQRPVSTKRGLLLVGLHLSNFDFILQSGYLKGLNALVLTIAELQGGYRLQYEMRKKIGIHIVPASVSSIRAAVNHLQTGGVVLTGIDRPDSKSIYRPRFFNHPAMLPVHHIFLALKAMVPIVMMTAILQSDGKYHLLSTDPIEMQSHPDRREEVVQNAEAILRIAEDFIRLAPHQWSMTLPVWPDILNQVPE